MATGNLTRFTPKEVEVAERQIQESANRIDYYITEYTIEILANKTRSGDYVVPEFQREFTWEEPRKWRFIESLLINLPIPFLFFWENPESGKLEIIDGSQRLRTLAEFLNDELELGELEKLPALIGFKFSDLPESRRNKFKNRSIRGIVLSESADEEARFDLFDRINTGSKTANKAEIRRGALRGPFMDLIVELAQDELFVKIAPVSERQLKEREREELVTRFFAYSDGLDDYADEVSQFLFSYCRKMNLEFLAKVDLAPLYRQRFMETVRFIDASIPFGFRRNPKGKVTPRARFEAIAIGSRRALMEKPTLIPNQEKTLGWLQDVGFTREIRSDGANAIARLEGRINYVRDQLLA